MNTIKSTITLLFLTLACTTHAAQANAQIRIGEFQPTDTAQYVEVYNDGQEEVDISGWNYNFGSSTRSATIASQTSLAGKSCMLLVTKNIATATSSLIALGLPTGTIVQTSSYNQALTSGYSFYSSLVSSQAQTAPESIGIHDNLQIPCVNPAVEMEIVPTSRPTLAPTEALNATPSPHPTVTPSVIDNIVISEVMIAPASPDPEWVELYNPNSYVVTLANWRIDDVAIGGSAPFTFSTTIAAQSYGVIELPSAIFNNSSDEVRLLSDTSVLIASTSYSKSYPDETWGKVAGGTYCHQSSTKNAPNTNDCLHEVSFPTPTTQPTPLPSSPTPTSTVSEPTLSPTPTTTKGPTPSIALSLTPTPTTQPAQFATIYISEFMPRPASGQFEWVELYNPHASSITITGWYIDDVVSGGSSPRTISSLTIPAYSYATYELSSAILNNDADSVRLLNSNQSVVDELVYTDAEAEISFSRNDIFTHTICATGPTRNLPNLPCTHTEASADDREDEAESASSSAGMKSSANIAQIATMTNTPDTHTDTPTKPVSATTPGKVAGLFVVAPHSQKPTTPHLPTQKPVNKTQIALSITTIITAALTLIRLGMKLKPW